MGYPSDANYRTSRHARGPVQLTENLVRFESDYGMFYFIYNITLSSIYNNGHFYCYIVQEKIIYIYIIYINLSRIK